MPKSEKEDKEISSFLSSFTIVGIVLVIVGLIFTDKIAIHCGVIFALLPIILALSIALLRGFACFCIESIDLFIKLVSKIYNI